MTKCFSQKFISEEISNLAKMVRRSKVKSGLEAQRQIQFQQIQSRFSKNLSTKFKSDSYQWFAKIELNNARMLLFDLYLSDYSDFEKISKKYKRNFTDVFSYLKSLENSDDPEAQLKIDAESTTVSQR